MHNRHNHCKGTWTRDKLLHWPKLQTASASHTSGTCTTNFCFGARTLTCRPELWRSQHWSDGHQTVQQGYLTSRREIWQRSRQFGSIPCKRSWQSLPFQLALSHHCANQWWNYEEPPHSLRAGFHWKHKGIRSHLCQHTNKGRSRQWHVLLIPFRLVNQRVLHYSPVVCQCIHRC